jgi:hypothetical protein
VAHFLLEALKIFMSFFISVPNILKIKKTSKSFVFKCELEENNLTSHILELFGFKKKVTIHPYYTDLSKKCKATKILIKTYNRKKTTSNSYRGKTKVIEDEEENESIEDLY